MIRPTRKAAWVVTLALLLFAQHHHALGERWHQGLWRSFVRRRRRDQQRHRRMKRAAGCAVDGGVIDDGGLLPDGGLSPDAARGVDSQGCSCTLGPGHESTSSPAILGMLLLALAVPLRRRRSSAFM